MVSWISNIFRARTAAEVLQKQLVDAERKKVEYAASQEEYAAFVNMLSQRITRIKTELIKINASQPQPTQENQ